MIWKLVSESEFMFLVKVGLHKGNAFLSYCKLFVEIYGRVFDKSLDEHLNLVKRDGSTSTVQATNALSHTTTLFQM